MPVRQDLSTPEKTLATFATAYSRRDAKLLTACLLPPVTQEKVTALLTTNPGTTRRLRVDDTTIKKQTAAEAEVTVWFRGEVRRKGQAAQSVASAAPETVRFRKTAAGWQIAPPATDSTMGLVNSVVHEVADRPGGESERIARVIQATNAERQKVGLKPVTENPLLTRAAQTHVDDMAARGFFDHQSPDGRGPADRANAAGYRWRAIGENIALGQRSVAEVLRSWMRSPGHRANILKDAYTEIGIGYAERGGRRYWVQLFAAPLDGMLGD